MSEEAKNQPMVMRQETIKSLYPTNVRRVKTLKMKYTKIKWNPLAKLHG